jgi:hypothetical protein
MESLDVMESTWTLTVTTRTSAHRLRRRWRIIFRFRGLLDRSREFRIDSYISISRNVIFLPPLLKRA